MAYGMYGRTVLDGRGGSKRGRVATPRNYASTAKRTLGWQKSSDLFVTRRGPGEPIPSSDWKNPLGSSSHALTVSRCWLEYLSQSCDRNLSWWVDQAVSLMGDTTGGSFSTGGCRMTVAENRSGVPRSTSCGFSMWTMGPLWRDRRDGPQEPNPTRSSRESPRRTPSPSIRSKMSFMRTPWRRVAILVRESTCSLLKQVLRISLIRTGPITTNQRRASLLFDFGPQTRANLSLRLKVGLARSRPAARANLRMIGDDCCLCAASPRQYSLLNSNRTSKRSTESGITTLPLRKCPTEFAFGCRHGENGELILTSKGGNQDNSCANKLK